LRSISEGRAASFAMVVVLPTPLGPRSMIARTVLGAVSGAFARFAELTI
jgi:hypothetical protein